jgi:hypothetical protein
MARRRTNWDVALCVALALGLVACEEDAPDKATPGIKPAAAAPQPEPVAAEPEPEPEPEERHDCPEGSTGVGSFDKPCEAKGDARMMEVSWTGKMDDKGPSFRVKNIAKQPIVYGKMAAYFYDAAGKQLELGDGGKQQPLKWCSGKIFQGPMKVDEKAVITFSCVRAKDVPEGTKSIEAEMQTVGYTDDEATQITFYWRNEELAPDARPKGGKKK